MAATRKAKFVTTTLANPQPKKHSVRFDAERTDDWLTSIYVGNEAMEQLGNPPKIKVTIEAAA
jgi:hypothetical protein